MMWPINATYMYERCEMTFSIKTLHLHLMSTQPPTLPSDKLSFSLIFKFKKEGSYPPRKIRNEKLLDPPLYVIYFITDLK